MSEEVTSPSCCGPSGPARTVEFKADFPLIQLESREAPSKTGMVLINAGSFLMGSEGPETWKADGEGPVRRVEVPSFWIDACAVSNAEFVRFVDATGYRTEAENFGWSYVFHKHVSSDNKKKIKGYSGEANWWLGIEGAYWRRPEGPGSDIKKRLDHPVVHVSWNDASAYCTWAGKSLPTEVQWEYAARGGLEGKLYPWGDDLTPAGKGGKPEHRCNIWQGKFPDLDTGADGWKGTAPVKTFAPNGFGLYQTSGNVWEWCADWFSPYHNATSTPETHKVTKGGSFMCHASYCNRYRNAARTRNTPDSTTSHTGFRCVSAV